MSEQVARPDGSNPAEIRPDDPRGVPAAPPPRVAHEPWSMVLVVAVDALVSPGWGGRTEGLVTLGGSLLLLVPGLAILRVTRQGGAPRPEPTPRGLPGG